MYGLIFKFNICISHSEASQHFPVGRCILLDSDHNLLLDSLAAADFTICTPSFSDFGSEGFDNPSAHPEPSAHPKPSARPKPSVHLKPSAHPNNHHRRPRG